MSVAGAPEKTRADAVPAARILVVEDEGIIASHIQVVLIGSGYEVVGVSSYGEEAVGKAEALRPDLVLMDIMLRGPMDGVEAAGQIRERFDIPVVYLTAYADDDTLARAKITEPFGYVLKPFERRELQTAIEMALYKHEMDIARKRAEEARETAERELADQQALSVRGDRLRSLGEMAAGMAHELSQPLMGVRGLAEHILIGMERGWDLPEERLRSRLGRIVEQADRMVHIINHVRMFAREAGNPETSSVEVNQVVSSAVELLGAQFGAHGIQLDLELMEDLPAVSANPFSLEEAVLNLLTNARDAVTERVEADPDGPPGRVVLRTAETSTGSARTVTIDVVDNGAGISEDVRVRAFDPFYTTKDPDKGTGLGLAISKSIVEQFDGTLEIQSSSHGGTTFRLCFPAMDETQQDHAV